MAIDENGNLFVYLRRPSEGTICQEWFPWDHQRFAYIGSTKYPEDYRKELYVLELKK